MADLLTDLAVVFKLNCPKPDCRDEQVRPSKQLQTGAQWTARRHVAEGTSFTLAYIITCANCGSQWEHVFDFGEREQPGA